MDFFKKLKKEKLLLSVMAMAMVDLILLAVLIVFPLMDFNYKSRETSKTTTENLSSNPASDLEQDDTKSSESLISTEYDGPISDKYNKYGVEGYNANKGNGGEAAKNTSSNHSTEDDEDTLVDDKHINTKDKVTTEEVVSSEVSTKDTQEPTSEEPSTISTEQTTENTSSEVITSSEPVSEAPQGSEES